MSGLESTVEAAALEWLEELGWMHVPGPTIAPDGEAPERTTHRVVVLEGRLRRALARINPHLPADILDEVVRMVMRLDSPSLHERNHAFHRFVQRGVPLTVRREQGERGDLAWLFDHQEPDRNDWIAVSQLTVVDGNNNRRPDLVLYVNGLPLAVIELKSPSDPNATIEGAHNQLQLYVSQIPDLFTSNTVLVVSDGTEARIGSLTAGVERFGPWRTIELDDRSTPAVFGDYIDTYSIRQAVEDGATVPIFYEARLARIQLPEDEKPRIDDEFDEVTEAVEEPTREKLKSTWRPGAVTPSKSTSRRQCRSTRRTCATPLFD